MRPRRTRRRAGLAGLAGFVMMGSLWFDAPLVREAQAVVGRPMTPVSYAGVARRTTRRTVAVSAATPGPVRW